MGQTTHTHSSTSHLQEYVAIMEKLATEKRLLHFATHGEAMKKQGRRGDGEPHEEL